MYPVGATMIQRSAGFSCFGRLIDIMRINASHTLYDSHTRLIPSLHRRPDPGPDNRVLLSRVCGHILNGSALITMNNSIRIRSECVRQKRISERNVYASNYSFDYFYFTLFNSSLKIEPYS